MEVVASLCQGRTAAAQCGLFTYKSVPVIFEPPCICESRNVRNRGYFSKPKGVREQKCLGSTVKSNVSSVEKGMGKGTFFVSLHCTT